jgi:hypothetical protein
MGLPPSQVWGRTPLRSLALFLAAIFCTFSAIGFLVDVLQGGRLTLLQLGLTALLGGTMAIALFLVVRSGRYVWIAAVVVAQVVLVQGIEALGRGEGLEGPALRERLQIDAMGATAGLVGGYAFFVAFIGLEGAKRLRLQTEVALARDIHDALVPRVAVRTSGFEIQGAAFPASEVGGDLVDVVIRADRTLAYVVDVSGHGVPAGTLMAALKGAARMRLLKGASPDGLLADLNTVLLQVKRPHMFATAAALALGPEGEAAYALAGHLPLLHFRARRDAVERADQGGIALGILDAPAYGAAVVHLEPGDLLAVVTDGLTEVFDARDRELGLDGIAQVLRTHAEAPLESLFDRVLAAARAHGAQIDDQTLLLVRKLPDGDRSP